MDTGSDTKVLTARQQNQDLLNRLFGQDSQAAQQIAVFLRASGTYQNIDQLKAAFTRAAMREPKIWQATWTSILQSLLLVAELDIPVHGHNNGAYFEVRNAKIKGRNGEPDFWEKRMGVGFGYNALITLVQRDGSVVKCDTGVVREGDEFDYALGTKPFIHHKPALHDNEDAPLIAFYAIAEIRDANPKIEIMPAWEVRMIRRRFAAEKSAAWNENFAETGRKTPLRRLCKTLTTSPRLAAVLGEFDHGHRLAAEAVAAQQEEEAGGLTERIMGKSDQNPYETSDAPEAAQIPPAASEGSDDSQHPEGSKLAGGSDEDDGQPSPVFWPSGKVEIRPEDIPF